MEKFEWKLKAVLRKILLCEHDGTKKEEELIKVVRKINELDQDHRYDSIFQEWVEKAIEYWMKLQIDPNESLTLFTIELAKLTAKNENIFNYLQERNVYTYILQLCNIKDSVKLHIASYELLERCSTHYSGRDWLIRESLWKRPFALTLSNYVQNDILESSKKFIAVLLVSSLESHLNFCMEIIDIVMKPLKEGVIFNSVLDKDQTSDLKIITSDMKNVSLRFIKFLLQYCLDNCILKRDDERLLNLIVHRHHLEQHLCYYSSLTNDKDCKMILEEILFLLQFFNIYLIVKHDLQLVINDDIGKSVRNIIGILRTNIAASNVDFVLDLCYYGHLYWRSLQLKFPQYDFNEHLDCLLESQFVVMLLTSSCIVALAFSKTFEYYESRFEEDSLRELCVMDLFKRMHQTTIRNGFNFKNCFYSYNNHFESACKSIRYQIKSVDILINIDRLTVFQMYIYTLKDCIDIIEMSHKNFDTFVEHYEFLVLLMEGLIIIIERESSIHWTDIVESIGLVNVSLSLLSMPSWPYQVRL